jgi:hypothetical protein
MDVKSYLSFEDNNRPIYWGGRVLRKIFGPKKKEITGRWRKLQNKELHNL